MKSNVTSNKVSLMTTGIKGKRAFLMRFIAWRFFIDELRVLKDGGYGFPAYGLSDICNSNSICQCLRLEIRLTDFRRLTIPQKQFIIY